MFRNACLPRDKQRPTCVSSIRTLGNNQTGICEDTEYLSTQSHVFNESYRTSLAGIKISLFPRLKTKTATSQMTDRMKYLVKCG